jgi:hypothetical protein
MSPTQKPTNPRKFSHYRVTPSLRDYLRNLPESHAKRLAGIQSAVFTAQHREKKDGRFVNIHRRLWETICRSKYRPYLEELGRIGELDINRPYRASTAGKAGFAMSYRVPPDKGDWETSVIVYYPPRRITLTTRRTRQVVNNQYGAYLASMYDQLTLRFEDFDSIDPFLPTDEIEKRKALNVLRSIKSGCSDISQKDPNGRMFHALLKLPSSLRWLVVRKDGAAVQEWDIKCCFAHLLRKFADDGDEQRDYADFLNSGLDFYDTIRENHRTRDESKEDFCRFINGAQKNYFYRYYCHRANENQPPMGDSKPATLR